MRIRHLHYFLIVAEEQSFTRAAARVHIEPSPLSRAIRELEGQLGVQLLFRSRGRIRLTWPGEVFRDEARRVLRLVENAKYRVHSASRGMQGRLRIGLTDGLASSHLTRLLTGYRETDPGTEIHITEMTVSDMRIALEEASIDIGLTVDDAPGTDYLKQSVWQESPVVAIPTRHPLLAYPHIPLAEICRYPILLYHPQRCEGLYTIISRWFHTAPCQPVVANHVVGHELMVQLVAAGYGIGLGLASQVAVFHHPEVIIRPVEDTVSPVITYAVTRPAPLAAELERFIARARKAGDGS